ncbi:helix-turn-helix domain-containing protein [Flavobacterium plurextorum]|uniref:AraC family transcriptional regulator n=1 Tax=Flavobacterium plurextorum TaxID=1114867 RepID=A0ABX4CTD4_9FLAO|nr:MULTISPECIES: helix-turn-helix domain-containing protein [Flavobacterium]OXB05398.1 AraC family transcriptional regulator [Flavobacterium plurextorum]PIF71580.1 AraC-like DNA-binding protein [Flavobacterium sp. 2]UUW09006.1 helix-turn-helix domain-containing protein [Flavobacterium plurextorum]
MDQPYDKIRDTLAYFEVDNKLPYYVSSGKKQMEYPQKPFRMDYYSLCICTEGDIDIAIDGHQHDIKQFTLLIARPATIIAFHNNSEDFRMKLLFFEKEFLLKYISDPFIIERLAFFKDRSFELIQLKEQDAKKLIKLMKYLESKIEADLKFKDEIVRTIIFNLLLETAELLPKEAPETVSIASNPKDTYFQFLNLVMNNITQHKGVSYYAQKLHISNKYLIQIVKKAADKTPHEIIDAHLLKEAVVLLGNPAINISDIAYRLRFNSVSAFGRFFKKHSSISPTDYRRLQNL